jgi:hypothetical protein
MINERLINAPPVLAPPLLTAILDEVAWATEDEPTQVRAAVAPQWRASLVLHIRRPPWPRPRWLLATRRRLAWLNTPHRPATHCRCCRRCCCCRR